MRQATATVIFAFLCAPVFGQQLSCLYFEENYFDAIERIETARAYHLKTISVISFNKFKTKTRHLTLRDTFDIDGRILKKFENFTGYKDHLPSWAETDYFYNNNGLLSKIVSKEVDSWRSLPRFNSLEIGYFDDGKPRFLINKDSITKDMDYVTLYYYYNNNGAIAHKYLISSQGDTIYQQYDSAGSINQIFHYLGKTEKRIIDSCGCNTTCSTDTNSLCEVLICDSLCNILTRVLSFYHNGQWIEIFKYERTFIGKTLIDEIEYIYNRTVVNHKGKLVFNSHTKYEYDENGLINKEIMLYRFGRVIKVKEFFYEEY